MSTDKRGFIESRESLTSSIFSIFSRDFCTGRFAVTIVAKTIGYVAH
jgi:hypothetical protein